VVSAIVAHLIKINKRENADAPILICTPSNAAADLIAERLRFIPDLNGNFIRLESEHREDIYNIDLTKVKEYQLLYKLLTMREEDSLN
jgi:hypothetical protein